MKVRDLIHRTPIYDGVEVEYPLSMQGWNSWHPILEKLIAELRPQLLLELGTWKGASALWMSDILRKLGIDQDAELVCVDTWTGSLEFWDNTEDPTRYGELGLVNGYPTVYRRFLHNVIHYQFTDLITPFPVPTSIALQFFKKKSIEFDMVYLDASHTYRDVVQDAVGAWDVIRKGGVLLGDDYDWPEVREAVECIKYLGEVHLSSEKWWIYK